MLKSCVPTYLLSNLTIRASKFHENVYILRYNATEVFSTRLTKTTKISVSSEYVVIYRNFFAHVKIYGE